MFGNLRPGLCHVRDDERAAYRRMYCGTCQALGDHYGQLTRPLLSFDVVLLASVIEGLQTQPSSHDSCRCPMLPVLKRQTLASDSVCMRVAAAVQVVLADQWLEDKVQDGRRSVALVRPLFTGRAAHARADLHALGLRVAGLEDLSARQLRIESRTRDVTEAAEPTAALLESLLGQIGKLPGAMAVDAPLERILARLGRDLGTAVYALDAIDDLRDDLARGRYNPCVSADGRVSLNALERVATALTQALAGIERAVALVPWQRNQQVVASVLCQRLPARCRQAIADARAHAAQWLAQPPRRRVWPIRGARALIGVLAFVWSWFGRRVSGTRSTSSSSPSTAAAAARSADTREHRTCTRCELVADTSAHEGPVCAPSAIVMTPTLAAAGASNHVGALMSSLGNDDLPNGSPQPGEPIPGELLDQSLPDEQPKGRYRQRKRKRKRKRERSDDSCWCWRWWDEFVCCEGGCCCCECSATCGDDNSCCDGNCCDCNGCDSCGDCNCCDCNCCDCN